jgi:hypothetical protein
MKALEKAREELEKAKARLQREQAKMKEKERKQDTRKKIILGAALLAAAKANPQMRDWLRSTIIPHFIAEKDRALFGGE